jgi:hypothetical protein
MATATHGRVSIELAMINGDYFGFSPGAEEGKEICVARDEGKVDEAFRPSIILERI